MTSIIRFMQVKTKMMILHVCEDGNNDAQRMLDQRAATETFDENRTLLRATTKQQQAINKGPPGYLYTHIHIRTLPRTHSCAQSNTQTHTLHSSQYISSTYTHWCRLEHAHAHTLKTYLTYKCLHSRAHIPA